MDFKARRMGKASAYQDGVKIAVIPRRFSSRDCL